MCMARNTASFTTLLQSLAADDARYLLWTEANRDILHTADFGGKDASAVWVFAMYSMTLLTRLLAHGAE